FRSSIPRLCVPLSTLRPHPYEPRRMTRGQNGALLLSCAALSSATPCRFNPGAFLDHFIRPREKFRRECQTDLFRSLQVDHELKLLRLLHRQISRFGTFQDLVHVNGFSRNWQLSNFVLALIKPAYPVNTGFGRLERFERLERLEQTGPRRVRVGAA